MASIEELRKIAEHLSPGFKIAEHEVAPILSALVQFTEHGNMLAEAAKLGGQAVADFYHDAITAYAEQHDLPAPPKGAPVHSEPAVVGGHAAPAPAGITVEQVNQIVQQAVAAGLAAANAARPDAATVTVGQLPAEPAPASAPANPADPAAGHGEAF